MKGRIARFAVTVNQAIVLRNKVLGNTQAKAGALGTMGDHGEKYFIFDIGADARAVVTNTYAAHQTMAVIANGEAPNGTGL